MSHRATTKMMLLCPLLQCCISVWTGIHWLHWKGKPLSLSGWHRPGDPCPADSSTVNWPGPVTKCGLQLGLHHRQRLERRCGPCNGGWLSVILLVSAGPFAGHKACQDQRCNHDQGCCFTCSWYNMLLNPFRLLRQWQKWQLNFFRLRLFWYFFAGSHTKVSRGMWYSKSLLGLPLSARFRLL